MKKDMNNFWTIRVTDANYQAHLFAIQSKDDCYISANTKIVGFGKAVMISTHELALSFCDSILPTLRRRHGDNVQISLATCRTTQTHHDDVLVRARIQEKQFAPNRRPIRLPVS